MPFPGWPKPADEEGHRAAHGLFLVAPYCGCLKTFNVTRKRLVQPVEDEDNPIYEDVTKKLTVATAGLAGEDQGHVSWGRGQGPGIIRPTFVSRCGSAPAHFTGWLEPTLHPHDISVERVVRHTVNIKHLDGGR